MMSRPTHPTIRILLAVLLCSIAFCHAMPPPQWFADIVSPAPVGAEEGCRMAASIRDGLLAGQQPEVIAKGLPEYPGARIVFITLCDGQFPARTYFAPGASLREAVQLALSILARREPEYAVVIKGQLEAQIDLAKEEKRLLPPRVQAKLKEPLKWDSLRLDIVQAAMTIKGYCIPSSRLLLSSAVGLSFDTDSCLALTPEQLTGRVLMNIQHQLDVTNICSFISESGDWASLNMWMQMANDKEALHTVYIFESDSYYADASGTSRLFRTRPVRTGTTPHVQPFQRAAALASKIISRLDRSGTFDKPCVEWQTMRVDKGDRCVDDAALAVQLCRMARATGTPEDDREKLLAAASLLVRRIHASLKHYDPDGNGGNVDASDDAIVATPRRPIAERQCACLVENEDLPEDSTHYPRQISFLSSCAAAYLALDEYCETVPQDDKLAKRFGRELEQLFNHIMLQLRPDCIFYSRRIYPQMTPADEVETSDERACTLALCGLVMQRHPKRLPGQQKAVAEKACSRFRKEICQDLAQTIEQGRMLPAVPELAEFLSADLADKASIAMLTRMALAATDDVETAPALPDMFGSPRDIPSMTYAAKRASVAAIAVQAFAKAGQLEAARETLAAAWPLAIFQAQAFVTSSECTQLPNPAGHEGFCRDNLADFAFTMDGQISQIRSHLDLHDAAGALKLETLPVSPETEKLYESCWSRIDHRPLCLSKELVILKGKAAPLNERSLFAETKVIEKSDGQQDGDDRNAVKGNGRRK